MTTTRTSVLNALQVSQRLDRLAWQVFEHCYSEKEIIIAGIVPNGYRIAEKIAKLVKNISPLDVQLTELHIDKDNPLGHPPQLSLDGKTLKDKTVIVVDDVSNSGRTLMYGVKAFLEFPVKSVLTLVLVDRDHNRFPVKTNFVGLSLATTLQEHITVEFGEKEKENAVYLD